MLKIIVRHLWRQRLFTILNIVGLAIGISACWIIYQIVDYEFSYDGNLPQKENIYRVVSGFIFDGKEGYNGGVSEPLYEAIRNQKEGIRHVAPIFETWIKGVRIDHPIGEPLFFDEQSKVATTDSAYFNMLPYKWLAGNKSTALDAPQNVVLTESKAKQYFPHKKPDEILNKTITYYSYRDTITRTVTGVVADLKTPTEFTAQEFYPLQHKVYDLAQWTNTNGSDKLYLQLNKNTNPEGIAKRVNNILQQKTQEWNDDEEDDIEFERWLELLPLKESHFSTYIQEGIRKASKPVMYGLMGIALFLLLLACINYINMSIAAIPQRAKEIGVRKTMGGSRAQLIGQFLYETFLTMLVAGLVSILLSHLGFGLLEDIIPEGITPFPDIIQFVIFIAIICITITLLAGLYPGWLITKVKTVSIFRNIPFRQKNRKGFSLQKVLIVFQFTIALLFITGAIIVRKQLHYSLTSDMGFNKDAVVLVRIPWKYASDKSYENRQFTLFSELQNLPGIKNISLGTEPMTNGYSSSLFEYVEDGKDPVKWQVYRKWIDTAYIDLYGMELLAGRNLHASDTVNEYVINETAVKAFGFETPQEAVGKLIGQQNEKRPIVGVVKDFHLRDFYTKIDPMAFQSDRKNLQTFNIKLGNDTSQWQTTLQAIEKKWSQFYPSESFAYSFYDETIKKMYAQERHLATLINLATAISVFISCLGLFGLAVLTVFQRTKEIGIRKVLGASVGGIVKLLSKEYIGLVLLAFVIASPIAWYVMHQWLEDFAYRIQITWWMFLLAGMVAIVVALITVGFQAVRAATANPVESLRDE